MGLKRTSRPVPWGENQFGEDFEFAVLKGLWKLIGFRDDKGFGFGAAGFFRVWGTAFWVCWLAAFGVCGFIQWVPAEVSFRRCFISE